MAGPPALKKYRKWLAGGTAARAVLDAVLQWRAEEGTQARVGLSVLRKGLSSSSCGRTSVCLIVLGRVSKGPA